MKELKEEKKEIEKIIATMIKEFEKKYDVTVESINLHYLCSNIDGKRDLNLELEVKI